ncbi:hypothetical protein [Algivirga pacifica]|uniref:AAA+ ATPase domain-containing protein n=1 Tax=Algivirga pacifica TaxID=1162670 RepID=A0ABP9D4B4_9BACT
MKVNQLNDIFDNFNSYYALDEDSYIVAVQDSRNIRSSKKFIIPLFYFDGEHWERLNLEDIGDKVFMASKPLETEFLMDEFIKVKGLKINTKRTENEQFNLENSLTKYITHSDKLDHLYDEYILDIFSGKLDLDRQLFYPDKRYYDLIDELYVTQNKKFLVENTEDGKIYGVFNGVQSSSDTKSVKLSTGLKKEVEIFELPENTYLELNLGKYGKLSRKIVKSYQDIELYVTDRIDFLSRKELFDWVEQQLSLKTKFDSASEVWDVISKNSHIQQMSSRYLRLKMMFEKSNENLGELREFLTNLAGNEFFLTQLNELQNQKLMLENELNQLRLQKQQELDYLEELKEEESSAEQRIKLIKDNEEHLREELKKQREEEINKEMKQKLSSLEKIDLEIKEKEDEIALIKKHKTLEDLKLEIENQERFREELKASIEILKKEFIEAQGRSKDVLAEFLKTKTHFDLLTGKQYGGVRSSSTSSTPTIQNQRITTPDTTDTLKELTQKIHKKLTKIGRSYPEHFIANLLINIHQNTLTLIAGMPGTGKSSLAKGITQALVPKERIVEISVARGWTSQKDLIGFANPITKQFHRSATGMYDLLQQLSVESDQGWHHESPFAYVVLDEANLSPLEHYWGTFYSTTDTYASDEHPLTLQLGNGESIHYPNNLRFIGTINIDRTTENISPRLLDRTPIIRLEMPKQIQFPTIEAPSVSNLNLDFKTLRELFQLRDFKMDIPSQFLEFIDPEVEERYDTIENTLRYLGVYISPRVKKSIIEYCNVAHNVMSEQLRPLDYCIAQRVLTKIDLQGKEAHEGLKNLLSQINDFGLKDSRAASVLGKILEKGEREGYSQNYFNYFLID